jgi:hypothetical protein
MALRHRKLLLDLFRSRLSACSRAGFPTCAFSLKFRPAWSSDRRIAPAPIPKATAYRQTLLDQAWFSLRELNLVVAQIDDRVIQFLGGR